MAKLLYLDCFSGASGDMLLGALLDMGVPLDGLREALRGMLPDGCELRAQRVLRSGIGATQFSLVEPDGPAGGDSHRQHRHLPDILRLIQRAGLSTSTKARATALFERLGRVEAAIHQMPVERVHFHEVGALDSIVDIVGAVWAIEQLAVDRIVSSPLNLGSGTVETTHGRLPVPAPATLRLLEDVPVYSSGVEMELVTPTGALLVTGHASAYGPMPAMIVRRQGYGAGGRDIEGHPNVLRAVVGDADPSAALTRVVVLECNIDDMNPQLYGVVLDALYALGVLEVFFTPVQMKKNRPGTLLTVVASPDRREAVLGLLFRHTTTIGVRYQEMARECLAREFLTVTTPYGSIRIKIARRDGVVMNAAPEFDDCARRAAEHGVPVKDVHAAALKAYFDRPEGD